jgi:hypothetical protein
LSHTQKVARDDAAKEILRILHESEVNDFDSIATDDESWLQNTAGSSKMFTRSAADIIARTQQAVGAKQTMITVFFTIKKLIMFDVLPRHSTFNQLHFINKIFPDLKTVNLNFRRQKTGSTFGVHMDTSMCHGRSKVPSKLRRATFPECRTHSIHQIYRSPCDFWSFGMLY